jgi:hypothetical protein
VREQLLEALLGHGHGAELLEMRIWKLRIQKRVAAGLQARCQVNKRHLARIRHARELAFGEERGAQR